MVETQGGRLIYRRDNNPANWLFVIGPFLGYLSPAVANGDNLLWALAVALALAALAAGVLWLAFAYLGETQLARVERVGDHLLVQHVDLLGRGRTARIPIASTGNWRMAHRSRGYARKESLAFDADGQTYQVQIEGAQVMDKDAWWDLSRISF